MAYNPNATTLYVQRCETAPVFPGGATDCEWVGHSVSALEVTTFDRVQLNELFTTGIYLFSLIFIIFMIKKAIQQ